MKFYARRPFRFGPRWLNLTLNVSTVNGRLRFSWSLHAWRYTYNITRHTSTFDTPGPGYLKHQHRR